MRTIVFRVDASPVLGGGHVMRCLTLAGVLAGAGWRCVFACHDETVQTVRQLRDAGFEIVTVPEDGAAQHELLRRRFVGHADLLVVDKYDWRESDETACRTWAPSILVIDDLADRVHDCDFLLDQTYGRQDADYASLAPEPCIRLLGADFALLRDQFRLRRFCAAGNRRFDGPVSRLLVSMGMMDHPNVTAKVLSAISRSSLQAEVVVVLGANAPHIDAVRQVIDAMPQTVSLALDVAAMADLVAEADLAIGAMGTSTWERCCLGLPTIAIVCADNQAHVARQMEAIGAVRNLGDHADLTGDAIAGALVALASSPEQRAALSARALRVCDGLGAHRVAETLDGATAPTRRDLRFRPVSLDDAAAILEWQKHPDTRRYFRNSAAPSPDEHMRWLEERVARRDGLFEMACLHGRPVGTVRLDPRMGNDAAAAPRYEVSIVVAPEDRNAGVGGLLLRAVRRWFPEADLIAEILPGNRPSQRLFEKAGYVYDGETYYVNTGAR